MFDTYEIGIINDSNHIFLKSMISEDEKKELFYLNEISQNFNASEQKLLSF